MGRPRLVINPTHVGSDTSFIKTGGLSAFRDGINLESITRRIEDIHFLIDQLEKLNAGQIPGPDYTIFKDHIDLHHLGMAGHSFGGATTLMIAGETLPKGQTALDPRITAAIAMSPQPAAALNQDTAFGSIKIPVFHITGTDDDASALVGTNTKAADRRIPFDHSTNPDTLLVIYTGANHMTFAPTKTGQPIGAAFRKVGANDAAIHTFVQKSTTAFWDAWLKNDPVAKHYLLTNFPKELGANGTFETKSVPGTHETVAAPARSVRQSPAVRSSPLAPAPLR